MSGLNKRLALLAGLAAGLFLLNLNRDRRWTVASRSWQPVTRKPLTQSVKSPGVVEAANLLVVKSEVSETILKRHAREGDAVKAGQTLLELSQSSTKLEHDQKLNGFRNAKYELEKARKELTVQRNLFKKQAVPFKNVEEAANNLEKATAGFGLAEQELALAKEKLAKTTVLSPMAGVILKDHLVGKDKVKPELELFTLGDVSRFMVRAKVDELDIPQVREGQNATIEVDAYPGHRVTGKVASIAPQAERQGFAKVDVLIAVEDAGGIELKHNLSVQSHILVAEIPQALAVPIAAVQKTEGKSRVLVRDLRGRLRWRLVELGRLAQKEIEVTSGLAEGESVGVPLKDKEGQPGREEGEKKVYAVSSVGAVRR